MSYLAAPRLHFFGEFIAEPSTINNDPSNFSGPIQDPGWNPNGNHRFAFAATTVTSIVQGGSLVTTGDPLIGGAVTTPGSPFAKLVDLDVDVQMASRIYGLQVQVADSAGNSVRGTMATANFRDFWSARLLGVYQSTLGDLQWQVASGSSLAALKAASPSLLSIRFIVDLYTGMRPGGAHRGRLAGAIGPATTAEPAHWVAGRRIVGTGKPSALAELRGYTLTVDVGNVVPMAPSGGGFAHPTLTVAVQQQVVDDVALKSGDAPFAVAAVPPGWRTLGTVPTTLGRYKQTSGIEALTLSAPDAALCASAPLGLFTPNGAALAAEDAEGLFVFPDPQAFPMNPGDQVGVLLTALTFGQPAPGRQLDIDATLNPGAQGMTLPASVTTDAAGQATVSVQASDPGTPRGPIDGQVFGFSGDWSTRSGIIILDAQSAVAVRVFSGFTAPAAPKWADIQPLFTQYNTMFPAMAAIIDLSDLATVTANKADIRSRLLLPLDDPGHMPVVRDLSAKKRAMIVAWIDAGCPA